MKTPIHKKITTSFFDNVYGTVKKSKKRNFRCCIIRDDDIAGEPISDMGGLSKQLLFKKYKLFDKVCLKNNAKIVKAVIPSTLNKELLNYLKDLKDNIEIAQHGYDHSNSFNKLDFVRQFYLIKKGKEILGKKKFKTETFIPPRNEFNTKTMKILYGLGFKTISAALRIPTRMMCVMSPKIQPYTAYNIDIAHVNYDLRRSVGRYLKFLEKYQGALIINTHSWTMDKDDLKKFDSILRRVNDKEIPFTTFSELRRRRNEL